MPPVHTGHPLEVMAIAAVVALVLILLGRLFLWVARLVRRWLSRHVPERISKFVGLVVAIALFWGIVDGVLIRAFLNAADELFATRDALLEPEYPAPTDPLGTGSAASLVDWEALGRAGREFVASGPTRRADRRLHRPPGRAPAPRLRRPQLRRDRRGPREARPRRDDPRRRLRPRGARRRGADRHRLDGPRGDGHARVPARRRHRDRRPAVFLPDQLDLAARRARLRHRHRPRAVPRRLRPLDQAAARRPAAALHARPLARRLRLRAVGAAARDDRGPGPGRALERPAVLEPDLERGRPAPAIPAPPSGCRPTATARSSASPTSRTTSTSPAPPGGRSASSTSSTPATRSPSSPPTRSGGSPTG